MSGVKETIDLLEEIREKRRILDRQEADLLDILRRLVVTEPDQNRSSYRPRPAGVFTVGDCVVITNLRRSDPTSPLGIVDNITTDRIGARRVYIRRVDGTVTWRGLRNIRHATEQETITIHHELNL